MTFNEGVNLYLVLCSMALLCQSLVLSYIVCILSRFGRATGPEAQIRDILMQAWAKWVFRRRTTYIVSLRVSLEINKSHCTMQLDLIKLDVVGYQLL